MPKRRKKTVKKKVKKTRPKKPSWKWYSVGRSKKLERAKTIKKSYTKQDGYPGTKIFKQKSGYVVKIKAPRSSTK